ncbi:helicase protein mom1-like isoform x1 [Anaeramoeba flamelloides]|uniref:Helicase protein mom1-like isoform x1 n=1 Tax=Anaeramoeba flamelloides TaxID=1746091 RepID=A0ABQ8Z0S5_9EUKA|nr:helicase protein mom1-like isoform x1 [Anaeramoeba flamelloides]
MIKAKFLERIWKLNQSFFLKMQWYGLFSTLLFLLIIFTSYFKLRTEKKCDELSGYLLSLSICFVIWWFFIVYFESSYYSYLSRQQKKEIIKIKKKIKKYYKKQKKRNQKKIKKQKLQQNEKDFEDGKDTENEKKKKKKKKKKTKTKTKTKMKKKKGNKNENQNENENQKEIELMEKLKQDNVRQQTSTSSLPNDDLADYRANSAHTTRDRNLGFNSDFEPDPKHKNSNFHFNFTNKQIGDYQKTRIELTKLRLKLEKITNERKMQKYRSTQKINKNKKKSLGKKNDELNQSRVDGGDEIDDNSESKSIKIQKKPFSSHEENDVELGLGSGNSNDRVDHNVANNVNVPRDFNLDDRAQKTEGCDKKIQRADMSNKGINGENKKDLFKINRFPAECRIGYFCLILLFFFALIWASLSIEYTHYMGGCKKGIYLLVFACVMVLMQCFFSLMCFIIISVGLPLLKIK